MFHKQGPTFLELARQALSSTERGYDLLAPKFDYTPFRTNDIFFDAFRTKLTEQLGSGLFDQMLDICCGTGAAMQALLPVCGQRFTGLDMSQGMLEQADRNLSALATDVDIRLVRGNAFEMPFADEFDLAVSFGAFGHILPGDEQRFVDEIFRVLRPGGYFAFFTNEMPSCLSASYWLARGFNGAMHVRNWLIRPHFIMYYLTFLWPDIKSKLSQAGFHVSSARLFPSDPKLQLFHLVAAQKPNESLCQ